jgi:hypothetical protein
MGRCHICGQLLPVEHPKYWLHSCHQIATNLYKLVYDEDSSTHELHDFMLALKDHIIWRKEKAPRLSSWGLHS